MSYCIGSFNLRDFNLANQSKDGEKLSRDFHKIAEIIIGEAFDVVALQEVNAEIAIKHLTCILKSKNSMADYCYAFGGDMRDRSKVSSTDPECYGFIWNNNRLKKLELKNKKNPNYYMCAAIKNHLRLPYYARFTARGMPGGSNFELRLVNVHIKAGQSEGERIAEFNTLVRQVLPRICDHQEISADREIMPSYTFLMGDYNLALNKSERAIYKIETITQTNYTGKWREYRTVQEELTTLKLPKEQTSIAECYKNNYDHFTYEIGLDEKLILIPQRIEALNRYFSKTDGAADKLAEYRLKVSDHVPIKLTIDLKQQRKGNTK